MVKSIKFNLICDGKEIRSLEELKENFAIEDVLEYYNNKMLVKWLASREYMDEHEKVKAMEAESPLEIIKGLMDIFELEYEEDEIKESLDMLEYMKNRKESATKEVEKEEKVKDDDVLLKEKHKNLEEKAKALGEKVKDLEEQSKKAENDINTLGEEIRKLEELKNRIKFSNSDDAGYQSLVDEIFENPDDVKKISKCVEDIVTLHEDDFKENAYDLFEEMKEKSWLAIMCFLMTDLGRECYLPAELENGGLDFDNASDNKMMVYAELYDMLGDYDELKEKLGANVKEVLHDEGPTDTTYAVKGRKCLVLTYFYVDETEGGEVKPETDNVTSLKTFYIAGNNGWHSKHRGRFHVTNGLVASSNESNMGLWYGVFKIFYIPISVKNCLKKNANKNTDAK